MGKATALTAKFLDHVQPPTSGRLVFNDAALPGFRLRVTAGGVKTFSLVYRVHGRQVRETIGRYPAINLATAHQIARESLQAVARGINPHEEKIRRRRRHGPDTIQNLGARYIADEMKPRARSWREIERLLELYVYPEWGPKLASDVRPRDVFELVDGIVKSGKPVQGNRVLTRLRHFFGWLVATYVLDSSPAEHVKRPTREMPRDRVLSDAELVKVLQTCARKGGPYGALVTMLALTGARLREVANLPWGEIDLDGKIWLLPAGRSKSKRAHLVPLAPAVVDLLEKQPRGRAGDFVFSTTDGAVPLQQFVKPKASLDKACGVANWVLHDLRRTAGTGMARLGVSSEIRGRVFNHAPGGGVTNAVYNQWDYAPEKREALEAWSLHVVDLLEESNRRTRL